ncbi:hypothetical protein V6Z11_A10G155500 [Gossypium hirsutum]|uniref:Uncharacterized protein n=1 Tax=Gossypium barbadense TaxID=3634 RepID=A0A2P5Y9P1_GOSBA|nr:hypothetical protein GOBAR_AA08342 [Gossypium barbadense]
MVLAFIPMDTGAVLVKNFDLRDIKEWFCIRDSGHHRDRSQGEGNMRNNGRRVIGGKACKNVYRGRNNGSSGGEKTASIIMTHNILNIVVQPRVRNLKLLLEV